MKILDYGFEEVPFWRLFTRVSRIGYPDETLLSVYREFGVVKREDRDDNKNRVGADTSRYQLVEAGDLVVNKMKAWQGSLGVSGYRGIVSPAYFVYTPHHSCNDVYLNYVLRSQPLVDHYFANSKGIRPGQWDLQPERLDQIRVPIPPRTVQDALVEHLSRETAQIDEMLLNIAHLSSLLTERRSALVTAAVTGQIDTPGLTEAHDGEDH